MQTFEARAGDSMDVDGLSISVVENQLTMPSFDVTVGIFGTLQEQVYDYDVNVNVACDVTGMLVLHEGKLALFIDVFEHDGVDEAADLVALGLKLLHVAFVIHVPANGTLEDGADLPTSHLYRTKRR